MYLIDGKLGSEYEHGGGNKGMKSFNKFIERTLKPITIGAPKSSFERDILESYEGCRTEALRKYFPMLNEENIEVLLRDDYLQKKDVKKVLGTVGV